MLKVRYMKLILLPNQLFHPKYYPPNIEQVMIYKHPNFYDKFKYSKVKINYHNNTIKNYMLEIKKYKPVCITVTRRLSISSPVSMFYPQDHEIEKEMKSNPKINITWFDNPNFLLTRDEKKQYSLSKNKLRHAHFYKFMRRKLDFMMNKDKPYGEQWSYDKENRNSLTKKEQKKYIMTPDEYKSALKFPVNRKDSQKYLRDFFKNKLSKFGKYQDYVMKENPVLNHSAITPMLNIGFIMPDDIIDLLRKIKLTSNVELVASIEGFFRQIIWREYMNLVYFRFGGTKIKNIFKNNEKITSLWYDKTYVEPVDHFIQDFKKYGYIHHIPRLMIIGNYMLLSGIHPTEAYKWFMELSIDGYEWVMWGNVLYMSQHCDGDNITTRPYISSSNYILRMTNFPKGDWCKKWDLLYNNFIKKNKLSFYRPVKLS